MKIEERIEKIRELLNHEVSIMWNVDIGNYSDVIVLKPTEEIQDGLYENCFLHDFNKRVYIENGTNHYKNFFGDVNK